MADDARSDDVEGVEADVEEARARLANTIAKLTSPETVDATKKEVTGIAHGYKDDVLRQVMGYRDGVVYDAKQRVLNNPLPVALIGAGIAWRLYKHPPITTLLVGTGVALLMRGGGGSAGGDRRAYRDPYSRNQPRGYVPGGVAGYGYPVQEDAPGDSTTERYGSVATDLGQRAMETGTRLREAAYEARSQITDTAERVGSQAQEAAQQARSRLTETAARASSATSGMIEEATTRFTDAAETVSDRASAAIETVQRNPLALGAIGIVAGLALGRRIRASDTGDYYVKATTDAFDRGARGVARGARVGASRVSEVASDAFGVAGRAASSTASLAGTVVRAAPDVASEFADTAGRAAGAAGERARNLASFGSEDEEPAPRSRAQGRPTPRRTPPRARPQRPQSLETGQWLERQTLDLAERYPLVLGAIGLALGAAVGGAIARTETENSTLGPVSDRLKARVRDLAAERFDEVVGSMEHLAEELTGDGGTAAKTSAEPSDFETVLGGGRPPVAEPQGSASPRASAGATPSPRPAV